MVRLRVGHVLLWTDWEWDSYYFGQSESGTGIIVDRVRVGQILLWTELEWDRYYCGQIVSGTGIIL